MSYKDFAGDRNKGILKDVMFFYGAEDYLISWAKELVTGDNVPEENRDIDVTVLEGERLTASDIMAAARAYSMFSDRRVVIVNNFLPLYKKAADPDADELLGFAASPQDSSVVVFILGAECSRNMTAYAKKLAKACSSYEFARLERVDLKNFIIKRVQSSGKLLARRELEHLIDITGYYNRDSAYDLTRLDRDISKLIKACEGDVIEADLIEEILIGDSDRFVFNLVDALTAGDRGRALGIAESIIRDEDGAMAVLALLTKQFEIMYDSLELSEAGMGISGMSKKTGVNEFRFKKAYNAARAYPAGRLKGILTELYNTDRDIKRGNIDKDTALELISISACPSGE